jgi:hypothetical protein
VLFSGNKTPASAKATVFKAKADTAINAAINSLTIIFNEHSSGYFPAVYCEKYWQNLKTGVIVPSPDEIE